MNDARSQNRGGNTFSLHCSTMHRN